MSHGQTGFGGDGVWARVWLQRCERGKDFAHRLSGAPAGRIGRTSDVSARAGGMLPRAQELDRIGTAIDYEIAAIDREAAVAKFEHICACVTI
jgi:hypothetical protein